MNDDHGAKETRLGFAVKLFLNTRIAHEDKRAEVKKEPGDSIRDLLDKALPS